MRTFVILLTAAFLAIPVRAGEWADPDVTHHRRVEPAAELRSNGTAIIDFATGSQAVVVGKTDSRLEARFAPAADQVAKMPHALFVLTDGTVVIKAIMYRWTTPVDVQIALPYSDAWQVRAIYVGGIMDYAKVGVLPPMLVSGKDFSSGLASAPVISVEEEPRRMETNETDCFPTGGGCYVCFDCWWKFCGEPYALC